MKRFLLTLLSVLLLAAGLVLRLGDGVEAEASVVTIQVSALEKIVLSMDNPTLDFGSLQPGSSLTATTPVSLSVSSNVPWDLSYSASGLDDTRGLPLSSLKWGLQASGSDATAVAPSGAFVANEPKTAAFSTSHYYTITMPWTATPGLYAATVTYTALAHQ